MAAVSQAVYMLGSLIAATLLGQLADRYGRLNVLVPTGVLQLIFALMCGIVNNYLLYTIVRFIVAINTAGAYMIGFVLGKKKKKRKTCKKRDRLICQTIFLSQL